MKLRRFNIGGINRFEQFLASAERDPEELHTFFGRRCPFHKGQP